MSSRFYKPDGTLVVGLREARKQVCFPSPTTVLSMLTGQGLVSYFQKQMFESVATTKRQLEWTDEQYFDECLRHAEEHSEAAKKHGSGFHRLIQSYNLARFYQKPIPLPMPGFEWAYREYVQWHEANVERPLLVEQFVLGDGYGGTLDYYCELKDGRKAVADVKTQNLKDRKKFNKYPKNLLQAGAYGITDKTRADVLINLYFGSDKHRFECHEWKQSPVEANALFKAMLAVWKIENNWP